MSFGRQVYEFLLSSSQAYAKWDLEVSTSILKNRKKMLILLALALPILAGCLAEAFEYHEMLGSKAAYAPAFYTNTIFLASIAVGLAAGLITGCIGAGGGFIITPALMAAGVKGILAVGTDLFHIFAKAIMPSILPASLPPYVFIAKRAGFGKNYEGEGVPVRLRFQEELDWDAHRVRLHWINIKGGSPRLRKCLSNYPDHLKNPDATQ
jgi:Predicted permeases